MNYYWALTFYINFSQKSIPQRNSNFLWKTKESFKWEVKVILFTILYSLTTQSVSLIDSPHSLPYTRQHKRKFLEFWIILKYLGRCSSKWNNYSRTQVQHKVLKCQKFYHLRREMSDLSVSPTFEKSWRASLDLHSSHHVFLLYQPNKSQIW